MTSLRDLRVQLPDRAEEAAFRLAQLSTDHTRARVGVGLMLIAVLGFAPSDFAAHEGPALFAMLAMRAALLTGGAAMLYWVGRITEPAVLDRWMLAWSLGAALVEVAVIGALARDYFEVALGDIMMIFYFYTVVPNRLLLQAAPAALVGLAGAASVLSAAPDPRVALLLIPALLFANLMGLAASWQLQHTRRQHYTSLVGERSARGQLESALDEVRSLRGILPICAECKRIRDDEGTWHGVEEYLRAREGAEFSHGICPDCLDRIM